MGAYGDKLQWWSVMPPVWQDLALRLPRGSSYTKERDAGRVLIALRWPGVWRGRIFVRNVHTPRDGANSFGKVFRAKHGHDPVAVENMREFDGMWNRLKVHGTGKTGIYVPATRTRKFRHSYLHDLQERGWEVVAGPFIIEEPMHNCVLDLSEKDWAEIWATHRTGRWSLLHLGRQVASKFIDEEETPQAAEIRLHYRGLGVCEGWTPERVLKLGERWGLTVREIQHYICCESVVMDRFMAGKLDTLPGPVCLWLFFMERLADQQDGKVFTETLLPVLGAKPSTAAAAA